MDFLSGGGVIFFAKISSLFSKVSFSQDISKIKKDYKPSLNKGLKGHYDVTFKREGDLGTVKKQTMERMPGFSVSWHYSGMEVESCPKYFDKGAGAFVRNSTSLNFIKKN